uniref:Uncharacterized protein n=1 Tax=Marseillevirus LCMAC201 TaxID=2506605 RepID=A0A481YVW9_9VIRU|nr:MAG: hypothetical protein LCMAC201_00720 [Marseillevirus LCMAC201]
MGQCFGKRSHFKDRDIYAQYADIREADSAPQARLTTERDVGSAKETLISNTNLNNYTEFPKISDRDSEEI